MALSEKYLVWVIDSLAPNLLVELILKFKAKSNANFCITFYAGIIQIEKKKNQSDPSLKEATIKSMQILSIIAVGNLSYLIFQ